MMIKAHYKKQFLNSCKLFSYLFIERQYGDCFNQCYVHRAVSVKGNVNRSSKSYG